MDCHSLELEDLVGELAFGLDLDRNTLPLRDENDVKGKDKNEEMCATQGAQGAWNAILSNPMEWGMSSGDRGGMKLNLDLLEFFSLVFLWATQEFIYFENRSHPQRMFVSCVWWEQRVVSGQRSEIVM